MSHSNSTFTKIFSLEFLIRQTRQSQSCFCNLDSKIAIGLVSRRENLDFNIDMLPSLLTASDIKRLSYYKEQRLNLMNISDFIQPLSQLYFHNLIKCDLSPLNQCVLMAFGLQNKSFEDLSKEINLPVRNINGIVNQIILNFTEVIL